MIVDYIKVLRPKHYLKNLFIFVPIFFSGNIFNLKDLHTCFLGFVSFSLCASGIYIINDILDIENDKHHPTKKERPITSGRISRNAAFSLMIGLFLAGLGIAYFFLCFQSVLVLLAYTIMNILYSVRLKRVAIIDVTIISIGFLLRLFLGSFITETPLSMWIIIMTFLLTLMMGFSKRRDDILIFESSNKEMRKSINGYSKQFIDIVIGVMASIVTVTYIHYTVTKEVVERVASPYLYLTSIFVILGLLRYLQITFVFERSSSPTRILFYDRFIQITILLWILSFYLILYI